jgi:hypothetical protein
MRLVLNVLLLALISLAMCFAQSAGGRVRGQVWSRPFIEDSNVFGKAAMPDCEVIFHSKNGDRKAVTDREGNYTSDLPTGIYSVNAKCAMTSGNWEYHPTTRAEFEVKSNSSPMVNLMVLIKRIRKSSAAGVSQPEYRKGDLKSEFLQMKGGKFPSRKILIRYTTRMSLKSTVEYRGKRDYRQDALVSATSDVLAIYADNISVEKPHLHMHAIGHVIVEDGVQRREGAEATVDFDAADPVSTLKIKE